MVMNADGSGARVVRPMINDSIRVSRLAWSPGGTRIAYTYDYVCCSLHIVFVNADGSGPTFTPLIGPRNDSDSQTNDWAPAWSPNASPDRVHRPPERERHGRIRRIVGRQRHGRAEPDHAHSGRDLADVVTRRNPHRVRARGQHLDDERRWQQPGEPHDGRATELGRQEVNASGPPCGCARWPWTLVGLGVVGWGLAGGCGRRCRWRRGRRSSWLVMVPVASWCS